jgi:acetyl-CoA carboxylase carboxyl transferase subunit beta
VKETIKKELPVGFQTAEAVMENGFLDFIVHRRDLKDKLTLAIQFFMK